MAKKGLGRGLSALISEDSNNSQEAKKEQSTNYVDEAQSDNGFKAVLISLDELYPGKFQPRGYFDEDKLRELTSSISENGVIQPILVRPKDDSGKYQIVAGERRWRASKQAKLDNIPCVVKDLTDKEALEVALIENIQRQSLTPIEEAEGYKRLLDEFSYTQAELASGLGKSRSHIANMMRLLVLPDEVKDMINKGLLSMGHARALVNAENPLELAHQVVRDKLSVRETEKFASGYGKNAPSEKAEQTKKKAPKSLNKTSDQEEPRKDKDEDLIILENSLSENMGLKVSIDHDDEGGKLTIAFRNLTELDQILQKIG